MNLTLQYNKSYHKKRGEFTLLVNTRTVWRLRHITKICFLIKCRHIRLKSVNSITCAL